MEEQDIFEAGQRLEGSARGNTIDPVKSLAQGALATHAFLGLLERSKADEERKVWAVDCLQTACRELADRFHATYSISASASGLSVSFVPTER